jgi:hypothetical protein
VCKSDKNHFFVVSIRTFVGEAQPFVMSMEKKGSVGVMVQFCVQVQEVHRILDLCCAFRLK